MLEVVCYKSINRHKHYIPFDINKNSRLYYDNDVIHKIPFLIKEDFKYILEYIDECNLEELIELRDIILDKSKLVGYSFVNYKDYKSFRKIKSESLNLKLNRSLKIIDAFNTLREYDIIYSDFHLGNVLYCKKRDKVKICDLDGIILSDDSNKKLINLKESLVLAISYLYDVSFHDINVILRSDEIINSKEILDRYKSLNSYKDAHELINNIKLDNIYRERKQIKKKSKILSNTGYFNFDNF